MSAGTRTDSAVWAAIWGVGGLLVGAVLSAWLSAESSRVEALRQERRSSYADLLGTAHDCERAFFERRIRPEPSSAEFEELLRTGDFPGFPELTQCFSRLSSASAKVKILTDSDKLRDSSRTVLRATIALSPGPDEDKDNREQFAYYHATAEFEVLARQDANSPVVSPFLVRMVALVLVEVMLFALFIYGRRRLRQYV